MNNTTLSLEAARLLVAQGCPRTADVKAAKHHLYLHSHDLMSLSAKRVGELEALVSKHNNYQASRRLIEGVNAMAGSSRARWKRQQRPA